MAKTPEELEAEANEEFKSMNQEPGTPDTPEPVAEPANPNPDPVPTPDLTAPPEASDTAAENWEERYKNLQAHSTKVSQEAATLRQQLSQQQQYTQQIQQQQQAASLPEPQAQEPDALDTAAKDFEELAPFVKKIREQEQYIHEMRQQSANQQQQAEQQNQQDYYGRIAAVHPDHQQIFQSAEFNGWRNRLKGMDATAAQLAFSQGRAEDVIDVFTKYKASSGNGKFDQAAREVSPSLRSRSSPQTQPRPKFSIDQIAKMSREEFSKNEKAIDEAIMRGEVA